MYICGSAIPLVDDKIVLLHMADAPPPPPPRAPLSLYDNLLDPNDVTPAATISSAPVIYNQAAEETKKSVDPSLRFQPIRRPQVKQAKPKSTFPKTIAKPPPSTEAAPITQPAKSTLADWAATEDDEWRYSVGEKRQRGGRRNKKKKQQVQMETDWDDIYDPSRPTNIDEYLRSNEKIDEVREWKALLYSHRKRRDESDISDEDEYSRPPAPSMSPSLLAHPSMLTFSQINLRLRRLTHLFRRHRYRPRELLCPSRQMSPVTMSLHGVWRCHNKLNGSHRLFTQTP